MRDTLENKIKSNGVIVHLDDKEKSWLPYFYYNTSNFIMKIEKDFFKIISLEGFESLQSKFEEFKIYYKELQKVRIGFIKREREEASGTISNLYLIDFRLYNKDDECYKIKVEDVQNIQAILESINNANIPFINGSMLNKIFLNLSKDEIVYYLEKNYAKTFWV